MKAILRAGFATGTALAGLVPALLVPTLAHAGAAKTSANCGCVTPPPPCNCTVPTGHQVTVPGVNITPPSITVNASTIDIAAANVVVQASSVSFAQASSSASATASASAIGYANGMSSASAYGNGLAAVNALSSGGGGGFSSGAGASNSYIPALTVVSQTAEGRRVCAEFRAVAKVVAIQAVCLDDKDIPHPASQVMPDRDVLPTYEGEVFRCIAGSRMQYTIADYLGSADFARGQTVSCAKGDALYHAGNGQVACRPQRPARDCNERSLLRRYGAGIKVLKMSMAQQCVSYRSETAESSAPTTAAMQLDGGVGGVY